MNRLKYLVIGILAMILVGCGQGQTIVEDLKVPEGAGPNAPGSGKSIVILPFADYTNADTLASAHRRSLQVSETLTDRLVANGFGMPIQEDVFRYMIDQNLISLVAYEESNSTSLSNELGGEWSSTMKDKIRNYIVEQQVAKDNRVASSPGTHGLTEKTVKKIGRRFNADYVVRGRILEYKTRQDPSWSIYKKGIIPFVIGGTSRIAYGYADSAEYDRWGQMTAGATWGALLGYQAGLPFDADGGSSWFGASSAASNAIFWGLVGGALGDMAYHGGQMDQAVVQMRIWVQEAATGNLIWTNRIRVQVSPETVFSDNQFDALFNSAIEKSVTSLINNFVTYGL